MAFIGLAVGIAAYVFYLIKIKPMPRNEQKNWLLGLVILSGCAIIILASLAGKAHWLSGLLAAGVAAVRLGVFNAWRIGRFWLARQGGVARFSTEHIQAEFNANSLALAGRIIQGPCAGRELAQLSEDEIAQLLSHYDHVDKKSYYLLKAYCQFNGAPPEPLPNTGPMSPQEARDILGITDSASHDDIVQAHKRLIQKLHPDRGGSSYLATQVNLARDTLLKQHT